MHTETAKIKMDEWAKLRLSKSVSDRMKAVAIVKDFEGDAELAETLRFLADRLGQPDLAEDDPVTEEMRQKLGELIRDRKSRESYAYHAYLSDEEILNISNGAVTNIYALDESMCCFTENGLYEPRIFGGPTSPALIDEDGEIIKMEDVKKNPGMYFGHIEMPAYQLLERDHMEVQHLLKLTDEEFQEIVKYRSWVLFYEDGTWDLSAMNAPKRESDKIPVKRLAGGDAIHEMLLRLNFPDHPERYCFRILPVLPVCVRMPVFRESDFSFYEPPINKHYNAVMWKVARLKRLMTLGAPEIILINEQRVLHEKVEQLYHGSDWAKTTDIKTMKEQKQFQRVCNIFQIAQRYRVMGLNVPKPEQPLTQGPTMYFKFPKTVSCIRKDGTVTEIEFKTILEELDDRSYELFMEAEDVMGRSVDNETEKDLQRKEKKLRSQSDMLKNRMDDLRRIAIANVQKIIVKKDENGDYELANSIS